MHDGPDVRLVDSHTESDRRNDDSFSVDEVVLDGFAIVCRHSGVVARNVCDAFRFEVGDKVLRLRMSRNVDDGGTAFECLEERDEDLDLLGVARRRLDEQRQVGSVCTGREDAMFDVNLETDVGRADVVDDRGSRGRREAENSLGGISLANRATLRYSARKEGPDVEGKQKG